MIKTVNGRQMSYREAGNGTPIVLLHAFPLNSSMWDEQLSFLSKRFHIIAPDLRGFGHSESSGGQYSIDEMAADVASLLQLIGIDSAVLVGLSMGGYVAMAFYRNHPQLVRALVLADTRPGADTPEARDRRHKSAQRAETDGAGAIADDMLPVLLGPTTLKSRPDVVERARRITESNSPSGIASGQRAMAARLDSTELMKSVSVPTLVIVGSEDGLTPAADAEKLRDAIRGARLEVIPAAGHLSNLEQPELFSQAIERFVDSLAQ
jgi:pimeloyl-ACP methyl ester carboxylesterase